MATGASRNEWIAQPSMVKSASGFRNRSISSLVELYLGAYLAETVCKMPKSRTIDQFDRGILEALARDGRMPIAKLASKVGLTKTPCQQRLKRLLDDGYIDGFRAVINAARMGLDHIAFAEVKLTHTHEQALLAFNAAVRKIPEVEECHMIAGRFDYLLKIRTPDIKRYRHVLGEQISSLPFVASTSTNVAMETVKEGWSSLKRPVGSRQG